MNAQQKTQDKTPDDFQRYQEGLKKIFADHKMNVETHKSFFDDLIEWKRSV